MTLSQKQKKMVSIIPIIILAYLAITLMLYSKILIPEVNKITGNVLATVNVSESAPSFCDFMMYQGENLVSFHCINGMFPLNFMFSNISGRFDAVFSFETMDAADPWKSYNPNLPAAAIQDLSGIHDYKGYWIIMNQNTRYQLDGFFNTNSEAQLLTGWNLIGYPRETPNTPQVTFASIDGNYDLILQYKRQTNTWYYYIPGDPASTLTMIEPDFGYWIHMTTDGVWVFP